MYSFPNPIVHHSSLGDISISSLVLATMPITGPIHIDPDSPSYFDSLKELDKWSQRPPLRLDGVLPYTPRSTHKESSQHRGKLLARSLSSAIISRPIAYSYPSFVHLSLGLPRLQGSFEHPKVYETIQLMMYREGTKTLLTHCLTPSIFGNSRTFSCSRPSSSCLVMPHTGLQFFPP